MTKPIERQMITSMGGKSLWKVGTDRAPDGLSRAQVMALILAPTSFSLSSSGCTRVGSLDPSYIHMG